MTPGQWTLLFVFAQLALAGFELWRIRIGLASQEWPETTGTLQRIWQEDDLLQDGDGDGTHSVYARYRYQVGAQWYDGDRLSYGVTDRISFGEALDLMHGLRPGSDVPVYYDPGKPGRAVLFPGSSTANVVLFAAWLVGAALSAWFGLH